MNAAALRPTLAEPCLPEAAHWLPDRSQDLLDTTLGDLLRKVAGEVPDRLALVEGVADPASRRRWTYAELLDQSERIARALLARFAPGERVAVYAANSPEWVLLQHAMSLGGLILVPVNPAYTARELLYVMKDSEATGLFHDESYRGRALTDVIAEVTAAGLPHLREILPVSVVHDLIETSDPSVALPAIEPTDTLQIQYTSGTTGSPKGALLHHKGVINTARNIAIRMRFPDGGVHVNAMPMFHIAGAAVAEMGVIALRGTFVLMPHFDAGLMIELFESEHGNATLVVPTMILSILDHPDRARRDLSSWQTILSGAANVPAAMVRAVHEELGCKVCIIFGQTESNGPITLSAPDDLIEDQTDTVGKPLPHVEVRVVDPETLTTVVPGAIGEIWVRGYQTMSGYFNMDQKSAETIRPDGWLRTGDLGTMDVRGYVKITGRLKEMIIRGGMHLYPKEMEDVLFDHPDVDQVAILGVPDEKWGEIVAAVLTVRPGRPQPGVDELKGYCAARLASQKIPTFWSFVDHYPLTPSGKIQKHVLKDMILARTIAPLS
jgi:fatty-acyl-CoA synthase